VGGGDPTPEFLLEPALLWYRGGVTVWHEGLVRHDLGLHLTVMVVSRDKGDAAATMAAPWRTRIPIEVELRAPDRPDPLLLGGALGGGAEQLCCEFQFEGEAPPGTTVRIRVLPLDLETSRVLR
jgi:hypothetical protein